MRIYLSCLQSKRRHPIPAYAFWEPYFKRGIEEAGHQWVECPDVDWAEGLACAEISETARWRERTWTAVYDDLKRQHLRHGVDLFLGYLYPEQVDPDAVRAIQALGIPCVNFFCDNVREFRDVPRAYSPFDLHWVPERAALGMYRRAGLRAVHRPMPVWVEPALRTPVHDESYPATFIGSRDEMRERLFARALALGAHLQLRGPGWLPETTPAPSPAARRFTLRERLQHQVVTVRRHGAAALVWKTVRRFRPPVPHDLFTPHARPPVFGDDYARVTQRSRVTLGVNRYPSFRRPFFFAETYSRLRDVEAPMMGACYLTEWTPELADLYEIGQEIETYASPSELVAQLERLEHDPEHRRRLRANGQGRALAEHTVARTLEVIATTLGATM